MLVQVQGNVLDINVIWVVIARVVNIMLTQGSTPNENFDRATALQKEVIDSDIDEIELMFQEDLDVVVKDLDVVVKKIMQLLREQTETDRSVKSLIEYLWKQEEQLVQELVS